MRTARPGPTPVTQPQTVAAPGLHRRLRSAVWTALALLATGAPGAAATTLGPSPDAGRNQAVSEFNGVATDINTLVGATRYYNASIFGQSTVTTNLEAGHFWNGHETLQHVPTDATHFVAGANSWGGDTLAGVPLLYDRHATWVAMFIGGRSGGSVPGDYQVGIAPGTDLRSAAIATEWNGNAFSLNFDVTPDTLIAAYEPAFGGSDVVNSSWGGGDPAGVDGHALLADAYAFESPNVTYVVSAGNAGPGANTVGAPGSGYNAITVGALDVATGFTTVADFSSRAPQDFGFLDANGLPVTVPGVRAAVDISAPGSGLISAFYGGQSGGNNTTLPGSVDEGSVPNTYSASIEGTSFSAPIVAGGAALVVDAAKTLLPTQTEARRSETVKSLLLSGADKTTGWDNGLRSTGTGENSFLFTDQALDWDAGAGAMNLDRTFDIQFGGETDVPGVGTGELGTVDTLGWDFGNALLGFENDYILDGWLEAGSTLTSTLSWQRARRFEPDIMQLEEIAQADLALSIWGLDEQNALSTLIARSDNLYTPVEHLYFTLPTSGRYALRVEYNQNTFDNLGIFDNLGTWGSAANPQSYALSWLVEPQSVPAPTVLALLGAGLLMPRRRAARRG